MNTGRCLPGLILAIALMPCPSRAATDTNLEARRKKLNQLIGEEWEYEMQESPERATFVGDYRYNDKWSDSSLAHVPVQRAELQKWLIKFQEVDTTGFPGQEKLNQQLMIRNLKDQIEYIDLKLFLMPVDQFSGVHLNLAVFVSFIPFQTTKQYDDYLARLHKIPTVIDQVIEVLQVGEKEKLEPPAFLLDRTVTQCDTIATPAGAESTFGRPVAHFPSAVSAADQKRLHDQIIAAVDNEVRPAYRKLQKFLATEYAVYSLLLLVLLAFLIVSRKYIWLYATRKLAPEPASADLLRDSKSSQNPEVLLAEANRLAWVFNWPKAQPLYVRAEKLFREKDESCMMSF
jgi:uncharacterized protein (DUF885 family)